MYRSRVESLLLFCCAIIAVGILVSSCAKTPYVPGPISVLDNGRIRVGVDLSYGGMITQLSLSGDNRNLINNFDRGRQVQASYYAGHPLDRQAEGQSSAWSPWPWNPVGAGDTHGNAPEVLASENDGTTIYVKTVPLLWDMNNEAAECLFESWISLDDNRVWVTNRLTSLRTDNRWKAVPCHQEIPAVYIIADLHRLFTYEGKAPFSHASMTEINNQGPPWAYWGQQQPHEKWAALVDDSGWGVGVYSPDAECFAGGLHGEAQGDTQSSATGYIAPLRTETLDQDSIFEYRFCLIVGSLDDIRNAAYEAEGQR